MTPAAPPRLQGERAVTLGVFDGLHLGHRALVDRLVAEAAARDLSPCVVTLDPHPDVVLGHAPPRPPLTPFPVQASLLAEWGASELRVLEFDDRLRNASAAEFASDYLRRELQARLLVVGPDFALGRERQGTPARLASLGRELGFELIQVDPVSDATGRISSSRVRHLLDEGRVGEVAKLLGRSYTTEGSVGRGMGIGGKLGFPTANLVGDPSYLPADGVYLGRADGDFGLHPCLVSLGTRPTFGPGERVLEVYLIDFKSDIREHRVRLEWLEFLRGQQLFHSPEDLIEQMREDERRARKAFSLGA